MPDIDVRMSEIAAVGGCEVVRDGGGFAGAGGDDCKDGAIGVHRIALPIPGLSLPICVGRAC